MHGDVNPLVNWIWFGFGIMALGTGIALLPERAFAFAVAKLPEGAATTSLVILVAAAADGRVRAAVEHRADGEHCAGLEDRSCESRSRATSCARAACRVSMASCPMGPSCHGLQTLRRQARRVQREGHDARADA